MEYATINKAIKPLQIYIFLKFHTDGKVHASSGLFKHLKKILSIRDNRTLKTHLATLLKLNWIGFNPVSENYFIRGFNQVRKQYKFHKRNAAICYYTNIKKLAAFVVGAIITKQINVQKFLHVIRERFSKAVTHKRDVTFQPSKPFPNDVPLYHGLANSIIAKIFGCKQTRACQLKHQAEKEGFIKTKKKYRRLSIIETQDKNIRGQLTALYPSCYGKIKMRKMKNGKIEICEQMYDEILPNIGIKRINRANSLNK